MSHSLIRIHQVFKVQIRRHTFVQHDITANVKQLDIMVHMSRDNQMTNTHENLLVEKVHFI